MSSVMCLAWIPPLQNADLANHLRIAYSHGATDGVLGLLRTPEMQRQDPSPRHVILSAVHAAQGDKGRASGILNALLGSCVERNNPRLAWDWLEAYDALSTNLTMYPNLVSLCLVYSVLARNHDARAPMLLTRATMLHDTPSTCIDKSQPTPDAAYSLVDSDIQVLYETDDLLVVNKPSGMVTFHSATSKRKNKNDLSLEQILLLNNVPLSNLNQEGRGLVHRIDRGTSGCLVLAKTNERHAFLLTDFFLRRVTKSYEALVMTTNMSFPLSLCGIIDFPIHGRPAQSTYLVLEQYGTIAARIELHIKQGRKHQVRIHCSKGLGCPILLDPLYGGKRILYHINVRDMLCAPQNFCLHASTLQLPPEYGVQVIKSPLPGWWKQVVTKVETIVDSTDHGCNEC